MKLHKIISQLSPNDFSSLSNQLTETRADKFLLLLNNYRNEKRSDEELLVILDLKQAAFYTLKSRLFDKIQEFLYKNTSDTRIELLKNVANIEQLLYNTQPETSIGILKKLEAELIEEDMPNELILVYKALKKLHIHSGKYYEYLKLYNKHVAFNLAQDKAEDILSMFCKALAEYYLHKNEATLDILVLHKKEMINVCRLYQSHHLQIYKNILLTHFALFCPVENEMQDDSTIEEMLKESQAIIESHPKDSTYKHLTHVLNFLHFEYYHQLKLHKNAAKYYELISANSEAFFLFNHCCFVYHFLISKVEYFLQEKKGTELINEEDVYSHEPNIDDVTGFVLFHCYKASAEFYAGKYPASAQTLNNLMNEISFKNMPFPEMEVKSFIAIINIICDRNDQAEINIRSISRKISDENNETKYQSAQVFLKLIKTSTSVKTAAKLEKIIELNNAFESINTGKYAFLKFLKLDEKAIQLLTK